MVIKLSIYYKRMNTSGWKCSVIEQAKKDTFIQIIEDVSYKDKLDKSQLRLLFSEQGVTDIRFRNVQREKPEPQKEIKGNAKTFRDFFLGKHPDCDVKILGIAGEKSSVKLDRLFQTMADYMDYLMERNEQ